MISVRLFQPKVCVPDFMLMGRPFMHGESANVAALAPDNMFLDA